MLYSFFNWLDNVIDIPGIRLFHYISFRVGIAIITSLLITWFIGNRVIKYLQRKQISDEIRDLGLAGEKNKQGTPSMGGIIIIGAIVIPTILLTLAISTFN